VIRLSDTQNEKTLFQKKKVFFGGWNKGTQKDTEAFAYSVLDVLV
jgi:hypothetical protein